MRLSRHWCVLMICCGSCGTTEVRTPPVAPELPGGLTFREHLEVPAADIRDKSAERAYAFRYDGSMPLTITVFEMKSDASAFELVQKSRPQSGSLFFQAGKRYVLLTAPGADAQQLNDIAKVVEDRLR